MPSASARAADVGVGGVEEEAALGVEQVVLVGDRCGGLDAVGVVEQQSEVADATDAGLRADGGLSGLDAGVAERAFLGLAGLVVEVHLLVGAAADAEAPAPALVLVDEDDAVLLALVHRTGGAGGDAGGVEAVLADARQVEHERLLVLHLHLVHELAVDQWIRHGCFRAAGEVVVPVRVPTRRSWPSRSAVNARSPPGRASGGAR